MRTILVLCTLIVVFSSCTSSSNVYYISDVGIYMKIQDSGRRVLHYKEDAVISFCQSPHFEEMKKADMIIARKGIDWSYPLVLMMEKGSFVIYYETFTGATAYPVFFRFEKIERFQYSRYYNPDPIAHEQQDTLFFKRMEDESYTIKAPFVAVYFDEKFNRVFVSLPDQIKLEEIYPI